MVKLSEGFKDLGDKGRRTTLSSWTPRDSCTCTNALRPKSRMWQDPDRMITSWRKEKPVNEPICRTEPEKSEINVKSETGLHAIITFQKDKVTITRGSYWTFEISAGAPGRFTCPAGAEYPLKDVLDDLETIRRRVDPEKFRECTRRYLRAEMSFERFITAGGDLKHGERTILDRAHAEYGKSRRENAIGKAERGKKQIDIDKIVKELDKYANQQKTINGTPVVMIPNSAPPQNPYLPKKQVNPGIASGKGRP